ncbi:signal peptide peptidase-like 3 isoform X2 [Paramuricea clavata]|uniref:Signal peptide peptidase-like 3 isoform X2 n=1 Tax=Paramuricea clavata TaxID=317549 RepID=A0A7D9JD27_PARCT|nr:signal peptide peptidase-like 3 isoform X2 [Paramuricea clavata]
MFNYNFWLMDAFTSCLIFVSALAGDRRQKSKKIESKLDENSDYEDTDEIRTYARKEIRMHLSHYVLLNFTYFALMAMLVVALRHYPTYIVYIQHMAVVGFIMIAFDGWFRPAVAYPLGIMLSILWFFSGRTAYRWILNNIIIVVFTLMVGDIQFKNFAVLQIFMWSAFIYDVCVLAGSTNLSPSLFSVGVEKCDTLICHLFRMHDKWELPSVFTMKFGNATQVFLGTGDILLGALVVNFSKSFFKSTKYVVAVVLSFSFALGLLSQIDSMPFPALATIVPVCSSAIILCAFISGKTRQLFSIKKDAASGEQIGLLMA